MATRRQNLQPAFTSLAAGQGTSSQSPYEQILAAQGRTHRSPFEEVQYNAQQLKNAPRPAYDMGPPTLQMQEALKNKDYTQMMKLGLGELNKTVNADPIQAAEQKANRYIQNQMGFDPTQSAGNLYQQKLGYSFAPGTVNPYGQLAMQKQAMDNARSLDTAQTNLAQQRATGDAGNVLRQSRIGLLNNSNTLTDMFDKQAQAQQGVLQGAEAQRMSNVAQFLDAKTSDRAMYTQALQRLMQSRYGLEQAKLLEG